MRTIRRTNNVVHQMKETKGGVVTTKCGLVGKRSPKFKVSSWSSDITCSVCCYGGKRG